MATNFLVHEKIWFDKFKYDDAERKFYEQMNGPVAGSSRQSSGPGASSGPSGDHSELAIRIASLEVENQSLRGVVQDLQQAVSKLEARLSVLEKSSPTHRAAAPQTQHVSPMRQAEPPPRKAATAAEDDEDDAIDLFGSDEEEDKEAARLREERLRQYAEKKAKKPALVAKSSILLDVKPVSGVPLPPPARPPCPAPCPSGSHAAGPDCAWGPGGAACSAVLWVKQGTLAGVCRLLAQPPPLYLPVGR
uniref:Eukaryotic translation elongation factor 1 delta n=1 Tax=Canis lupus dingo TaxID=286419 RepID=A0A8C0L1U4_CANLU